MKNQSIEQLQEQVALLSERNAYLENQLTTHKQQWQSEKQNLLKSISYPDTKTNIYKDFFSQLTEGIYRFDIDKPMDINLPIEEQIDYLYDHLFMKECNATLVKMYGAKDESELLGKNMTFFHGGKHHKTNRESFKEFVLNGYKAENIESEEIGVDGKKKFFLNNSLSVIKDGFYIRMWGTQTDITQSKIAQESIKRNLEFQTLISKISSSFIWAFNMNTSINTYLKTIAEYTGAGRSYIFRLNNDGALMNNTHEWCAPNIPPQIEYLQNQKTDSFPWWMKKLRNGERIHINEVSKLPKEAQSEKEMLEQQDIKSLIALPLISAGKLIGFIGLDNVTKTKTWTAEDINTLSISSEILVSAIHSNEAEAALFKSERKYRFLTETMKDVISSISPFGILKYSSPSVTAFGGYIAEEEKGNHVSKYFAKKTELVSALKILAQVLISHKSGYFRFLYKAKDRAPFPVEFSYTPEVVHGNVKEIHLVMRDVSERDQALQARKESEEKFRNIFEVVDDGIIYADNKFKVLDVNPAFTRITNIQKEEIAGKNAFYLAKKFANRSQLPNILQFLKTRISNNKLDSFEMQYNSKILDIYASSLFKGERTVGVIRDITEKKENELSLIESENRFKALANATYEGIVLTEKGEIIDANEAFCRMSGYSYKEILGLSINNFFSPKEAELVLNNITSLVNKPIDALALDKNGNTLHVEVQSRAFKYKNKAVRIIAIRDISERKNTEIRLIENEKELQRLNTGLSELVQKEVEKSRKKDLLMMSQSKQASMGEMIGNIAHQWRQPLNDIGIYIQNLQDSYEYNELDEKQLNAVVDNTMKKLEYMSQTIDDFRNFFRSDKKQILFPLGLHIKKTLSLIQARLDNSHIFTVLNIQDNCHYEGYPNEFSQALLNILNNAHDVLLERNISSPQITINLSKEKNNYLICVNDNAGGINNNIMDNIFDPYFSTKEKTAGTGLGLYISKTIIEKNLGGKLSVSNTNEGAQFQIKL